MTIELEVLVWSPRLLCFLASEMHVVLTCLSLHVLTTLAISDNYTRSLCSDYHLVRVCPARLPYRRSPPPVNSAAAGRSAACTTVKGSGGRPRRPHCVVAIVQSSSILLLVLGAVLRSVIAVVTPPPPPPRVHSIASYTILVKVEIAPF